MRNSLFSISDAGFSDCYERNAKRKAAKAAAQPVRIRRGKFQLTQKGFFMATYLNPGNSGFEKILNDSYVDKTGMIEIINNTINTPRCLTCISRPRRFGKSYAAQMLCAYYDKSCDSSELFEDKAIADSYSYEEHLNRYDVIYVDMTSIKIYSDNYEKLVPYLCHALKKEITQAYPELPADQNLTSLMIDAAELTGTKFIMIIDEWDAPIRENPSVSQEYLHFLRALFKSSGTTARIFAAVYMTGILPIKKDGSQSAISDFKEYPVLDPGPFAKYTGFTEEEVYNLCKDNSMSFEGARRWYDGYSFGNIQDVYNPYSVMCSIQNHRYKSYWKKTSATESLQTYIDMNHEGLQDDIARLISGEMVEVDPESFENDFQTFRNKDDVLTLMIHLGYLAYEEIRDGYGDEDDEQEYTGYVRIPNEEVRDEFRKIIRKGKHHKLIELIQASDQLLEATLQGQEKKVAQMIAGIRESEYAPTWYNDEQSLRYVIKFAYITCADQYLKIEELPTGRGIADVVFLPKRRSRLPAMIIELKWNKSPDGAIRQIKERNYPAVLKNYGGEILLVGINYDEKTKEHGCRIEKFEK